jgi:hypothetical protein
MPHKPWGFASGVYPPDRQLAGRGDLHIRPFECGNKLKYSLDVTEQAAAHH